LIELKKAIASKYGEEAITKAWLRVCKELESVTDRISSEGSAVIPDVQFDDLFDLSPEKKKELMDTGCFVVRNLVSQEQAGEWFRDLKSYVAKNKADVKGILPQPAHLP